MKRTPDDDVWAGPLLRLTGFIMITLTLGPLASIGVFVFWLGIEMDINER